jgi:hypothetical protein
MRKKEIYPFWRLRSGGETSAKDKLPKQFRVHGRLQERMRKSIKVDKKTGEYTSR